MDIFQGKIIQVSVEKVTLPNGREVERELVRHPGAAAVVPLQENGDVVMVRQFRYAVGGYLYEVPAGKRSAGERPEDCAVRETEEEIGFRPDRLTHLTTIYTSPGFCDEEIHIFLGERLIPCPQKLGDDEILEVVQIPLDEAIRKIGDGTVRDGKSVVGLLSAYHLRRSAPGHDGR